jgi:hypothetical protein
LPYVSELAYGAYDHLVTRGLQQRLAGLDSDLVDRDELDPADSHEVLSRHIGAIAERALRSVGGSGPERARAQVDLANQIIAGIVEATPRAVQLDDLLAVPPELLAAIVPRPPAPLPVVFPDRPQVPLANGALLTNGRGQPSIGSEVNKELASANGVDLLCAFIKRRGVRLLRSAATDLIARGGQLRIITTTYMGATEQYALDELARLGAKIRISYETRTTRLHAKAWLFHRDSGVSTAYVG